MSTLVTCNKSTVNTEILGCPIIFNETQGLLFLKKGTIITPTQEASIVTTLQALLTNDDPKLRAYPLKNVDGIEDGGSDATMSESPYGRKSKGRDAIYGFTYEFRDGGMSYQKVLASFDGKQSLYDVMFIDKQNNALQANQVATGKKGFAVGLIQVMKASSANGTDPQIFKLMVELDNASEYDKAPALVQFPAESSVLEVCTGLYQTEMELATAMATGVVEVNLISNTVNLYDDYSTNLIGSSLIKAYNHATGNEITVTSIGAGTTIAKSLKLTLNTSDADYIAVPTGGKIRLELAVPSLLTAGGMIGFSECTFLVTKN